MALLGGLQLGGPAMHGLKLPARCLAAVQGLQPHSSLDLSDSEHADPTASPSVSAASPSASSLGAHTHRFLVGTCSAKEENELHCIEFDEEAHELRSAAVFAHPQEVWHLSTCPSDASICATTYATSAVPDDSSAPDNTLWQSTIWRMPGMGGAEDPDAEQPAPSPSRSGGLSGAQPLTKLVDLTGHVGRAKGSAHNAEQLDSAHCGVKSPVMSYSHPFSSASSSFSHFQSCVESAGRRSQHLVDGFAVPPHLAAQRGFDFSQSQLTLKQSSRQSFNAMH